MSILEKCVAAAPFFKDALGKKYTVVVTDQKEYLFYDAGEVDFGLQKGDPVMEGTLVHKALKLGKRIFQKVDTEHSRFGFPYIGYTAPLKEQNEVLGALGIFVNTTTEENVLTMSQKLSFTSQQLAGISENLTAGAQELAGIAQTLSTETENINSQIQATDNITKLITDVSDSTHILGINAAIEAARAGDKGRGFSVVAGEIQKLAGRSKKSAEEINDNLRRIKLNISALNAEIEKMASLTQEQSASTEETNASIQQLQAAAEELKDIADNLFSE